LEEEIMELWGEVGFGWEMPGVVPMHAFKYFVEKDIILY
jgi:hypothetical protein